MDAEDGGIELAPGTVLGPYAVTACLGAGGMGTVYRAEAGAGAAVPKGTAVALKVVHPYLVADPDSLPRFRREAELGRRILHDNVVRTHEVGAADVDGTAHHFLAMELVEGRTLRELLRDVERVPEELCRHIGREVAQGLAAVHASGVLHRDLKPENVLITSAEVVKVMDLGVARLVDGGDVNLTRTGHFAGSLRYAAPEQVLLPGEELDARLDLYSLGLVLFELATGRHPYGDTGGWAAIHERVNIDAPAASELNPQLSPFFEEVCRTLLERERDERFRDAAEVAALLDTGEDAAWWHARAQEIRAATDRPLRRMRVARETRLHGRAPDLAALRAAWDAAADGRGGVVLLEGEAGIGKSRLVDEFAATLHEAGTPLHYLFGSYPPGGAATTAGAFATAFRAHFGETELERSLESVLGDRPTLLPAFAALLRGEGAPEGAEEMHKEALQALFVRVTRALAAERPVLVLVDDLHFAPAEGRALFMALALAVPDHPVLLVGTTRPGLPAPWVTELERLGHARRHALARLDDTGIAALLAEALDVAAPPADVARGVARRSDGNPFFVFEILRELRESGSLKRTGSGGWQLDADSTQTALPRTVRDVVAARLAGVSEDERVVIDVAACCGYRFEPDLLGDVLGLGRIPLLQRLANLESEHRIVRSAGRVFLFDHHLIQETLLERLPELLRQEYHKALAEAVERREGAAERDPETLPGAVAADLCRHAAAGGAADMLRRYLMPALRHLGQTYEYETAVALAQTALDTAGLLAGTVRARALLALRDALHTLGRRDDAGAAVREARTLADEDGDLGLRADCAHALGWHLWELGRYKESRVAFEDEARLAEEMGDRARAARAAGDAGGIGHETGEYEAAREVYAQQVETARELGEPRLLASALNQLGLSFQYLGHYRRARRALEEAHAMTEGLPRPVQAAAKVNLGRIHHVLGGLDTGAEFLHDGTEMARDCLQRRVEAYGLQRRGEIEESRGELDAARRWIEGALAVRRAIEYPYGIAESLVTLGRIHLAREDADAARDALYEAAAVADRIRNPGTIVLAAAHRAQLDGETADTAAGLLRRYQLRLRTAERLEAHHALARATGAETHRAEARRLLDYVIEHAPDECRTRMRERVALHRAVAADG